MDNEILVLEFEGSLEPSFEYDDNNKYEARQKVNLKTRRWDIIPARFKKCVRCGCQAKEYHHHNGYDEYHQDDVIPVCKKCHSILEKELRQKFDIENHIDRNAIKKEEEEKKKKQEYDKKIKLLEQVPKTLDDARKYCYDSFFPDDPSKEHEKFVEGNCCFLAYGYVQCIRKNGYGLNNLFCKQHAKIINEFLSIKEQKL